MVAVFISGRLLGLHIRSFPAEFGIAAINGLIQGTVLPLFLVAGFAAGLGGGFLLTSGIYWLAHREDWAFFDAFKFGAVQTIALLIVSFSALMLGIR